jgi:hypothetical protein
MSGNAQDFNIETQDFINFILLHFKLPQEIDAIPKETLQERAPQCANNKICVAQFKCEDFPPAVRFVLDNPEQ